MLTQRNFNSYAEDPAAAAKTFKLRKARMTAESQYAICDDTYRKYQTAWSSLDTIGKLIDTKNGEPMTTLKGTTLELLDDPKGDARTQLSKVLDQLSQTIIQNMNQKYGENFIFAGADGHNVPFEIVDNKLYYRGISVDAAVPNVVTDGGVPVQTDAGNYVMACATTVDALPQLQDDPANPGNPLTVTMDGKQFYVVDGATAQPSVPAGDDPADYSEVTQADGTQVFYKNSEITAKNDYDTTMSSIATKADGTPETVTINGKTCYIKQGGTMSAGDYDAACKEAEKLEYLVGEKYFVDIGLGFQENENGQLIESSAFNAALNGLTFLGYGVDEDGDPKNIYSIVQKITELVDSVPEGGSFAGVWNDVDRLVGKLETAASDFKTEYTNMDAGTTKLKNSLSLLEDNQDNLRQQYSALEDVNMVESITSFIWAQYCYNSALKVGNSVLSQSLMDYLN